MVESWQWWWLMAVDVWARQEAEREHPALVRGEHERYDDFEARLNERDTAVDAHASGIVHAFDVLLSDKAVEAAARRLFDGKVWNFEMDEARAALQAAIAAVTEGGE